MCAGATATDIRQPDLSTTFEFNLQGGGGLHYFLRNDLALTFQWRFIHLFNAGIKFPNTGVNNSTFLPGFPGFGRTQFLFEANDTFCNTKRCYRAA